MKQRNAFTVDNSPGLDEHERKHANALFDAWARSNPYHGKDISAWQQRAGEAQRRFVEAIMSQRVPAETTAAARAPARVPIASQAPKPPLLPGQTVGERDPTKWPEGTNPDGIRPPERRLSEPPLVSRQYGPDEQPDIPVESDTIAYDAGDVAEVDPGTLRPKA